MNITWSVFPKFFRGLSVDELAGLIQEVGLDTTNAVIRDGYWVTREGLATEMPAFVKAMEGHGLKVRFVTAGFMPESLLADETPLKILADCGLTEFRMGYFKWDKSISPGACLEDARGQMARLAELCDKYGLRAVYQVHHGTLVPSPWAVWYMLRDLPARNVGVMLDPGNQVNEGWENWHRSVKLLGEHLVAMGIKDGGVYRDGDRTGEAKGWRRTLEVPLTEGVVNWYDVVRAIKTVDFAGTFVYMPFYHQDDLAAMRKVLAKEVTYLREVVRTVEAEG